MIHHPTCALHIMYAVVQVGVQTTNTNFFKLPTSEGAQRFHAWGHLSYEN